MKRISLFLGLTLLLAGNLHAAEPWFCNKSGTRLEYKKYTAGKKRVVRLQTIGIGQVSTRPDGGCVITYAASFSRAGGSSMYGGPMQLKVEADASGGTFIDISASALAVFRNMLPDQMVYAEGGMSEIPGSLQVGDTLCPAFCNANVGPLSYSVSLTERKVIARERITVPAGSFDCIVVSDHRVEKGLGRSKDVINHTWYAKGVGIVRHDNLDLDLNLKYTEELVRIIPR